MRKRWPSLNFQERFIKPIINFEELEFAPDPPGFPGMHALVASKIGARKLGYNVMVCPPGKTVCPFHNHRINEEYFFVFEGEGTLRFGSEKFPIRKGDFIACPPELRPHYHKDYFGAFVLDPDGHNIEAVCHKPK